MATTQPTGDIDLTHAVGVLATMLHTVGGGAPISDGSNIADSIATSAAPSSTATTSTIGGSVDPVPEGTQVTQPYGAGNDHDSGGHPGIDLGVPSGTRIAAAIGGTVTHAANDDPGGYGQWVEITGPDGTVTRYGHMSGINVQQGQTVQAGMVIGTSGGNAGDAGAGNSTGAHLHFEVRQNGQTVDPTPWLAGGHAITDAAPTQMTVGSTPTSQAMNLVDVAAGKTPTHGGNSVTTTMTGSASDTDPAAVDNFLGAIRQHESGGNYSIYNTSGLSNASGAYQFIGTTWKGLGGSTESAAQASPEEQDRIAKAYALQLFNQFHSWRLVAMAWFGGPGVAEQASRGADPGEAPGGQGSYAAYGDQILSMMGGK